MPMYNVVHLIFHVMLCYWGNTPKPYIVAIFVTCVHRIVMLLLKVPRHLDDGRRRLVLSRVKHPAMRGFPKMRGIFGGFLEYKDYSMLSSILGSPYFGEATMSC